MGYHGAMTDMRTLFRLPAKAIAAFVALAMAGSAFAMPAADQPLPSRIVPVASSCSAIGQQLAAQYGGTLASASPQKHGGSEVCVIVVVLPAKNGQRGRRAEYVVPRN